jgi:hypothetical protein
MLARRMSIPSTPSSPADRPGAPDIETAHVVDGERAVTTDPVMWREENREAFAFWNAHLEEHGLPLARYRQF